MDMVSESYREFNIFAFLILFVFIISATCKCLYSLTLGMDLRIEMNIRDK